MKADDKNSGCQDLKEHNFICILCRSTTKNDFIQLESKRCVDVEFVTKVTKLVTRECFLSLCKNNKSHNNKNYVCNSCFTLILKTYGNIAQLQDGVNGSVQKKLKRLNPSVIDEGLQDDITVFKRHKSPTKRCQRKSKLY